MFAGIPLNRVYSIELFEVTDHVLFTEFPLIELHRQVSIHVAQLVEHWQLKPEILV